MRGCLIAWSRVLHSSGLGCRREPVSRCWRPVGFVVCLQRLRTVWAARNGSGHLGPHGGWMLLPPCRLLLLLLRPCNWIGCMLACGLRPRVAVIVRIQGVLGPGVLLRRHRRRRLSCQLRPRLLGDVQAAPIGVPV